MATLEFYVRNESETDGRGPYTLDQLKPLASSGEVKPGTLYYDGGEERWISIESNAELKAALFPPSQEIAAGKPTSDTVNWTTVSLLLLSVIGAAVPLARARTGLNFSTLQAHPASYLALIDLILVIVIGCGLARLNGLVRLRAAVGFGFLGFIFWTYAQPWAVGAAALASAGLFFSTLVDRDGCRMAAWLLGVPGMIGVMLALLS